MARLPAVTGFIVVREATDAGTTTPPAPHPRWWWFGDNSIVMPPGDSWLTDWTFQVPEFEMMSFTECDVYFCILFLDRIPPPPT